MRESAADITKTAARRTIYFTQYTLSLGDSDVLVILISNADEVRRSSLTESIATADMSAVFGRYNSKTAGTAEKPFSEYIIAAEQPSSAPIPINRKIPKGCPKANSPNIKANVRNIVSIRKVLPNNSKAVSPFNSGQRYFRRISPYFEKTAIQEPDIIPINSIKQSKKKYFPFPSADKYIVLFRIHHPLISLYSRICRQDRFYVYLESSYALLVQLSQQFFTVSVSLPSYSLSRPARVVPPGDDTILISSSIV